MDEGLSVPEDEKTGRPPAEQTAKQTAKRTTKPTTQAAGKQAAPVKRTVPVKAVAKQATPKKAAPAKQAAPRKASTTKAAPRKASTTKAAPGKASTTKAAPGKVEPIEPPVKRIAPVVVSPLIEVASPVEEVLPVEEAPVEVAPVEVAPSAQVPQRDWETGTYDDTWSTSFDDRHISYARDRFSAVLGPQILRDEPWPYPKTLEIGAGTGFFSLNLRQAGVLDEVHVSDVSSGMVLKAQRNAEAMGFAIQGAVAGAESLPYPDDTFDLVVGHEVLQHVANVEAALAEALRVLRPGGRFVIAGGLSTVGDRYGRRLGRATWKLTTAVTQLPVLRAKWARSREVRDAASREAALQSSGDLHTFDPRQLQALAERAGAQQVRTQPDELLAAVLRRPVRTFEAAVNPEALGPGWSRFAYRSWQRLSALDRVLARALPASIFYNVGITGTKPSRLA